MSFVEKLQNKSRSVRVQILWISVVLVMVVIISLWLVHMNSLLKSTERNEEQNIPSLFNIIKKDFSFFKNSLKAEVQQVIDKENQGFDIEIIRPDSYGR